MKYIRQEILSEIGKDGQELLKSKSVAIIGVGGLGCASASLLARIGIKKLILFDFDKIQEHNLHRQILFNETHLNKPKATTAKEELNKINNEVKIIAYDEYFDETKCSADIILDCTDNLETRNKINEYATKNNIPWVHAAATGMIGNIIVFNNDLCFNCIHEHLKSPGTCEEIGIFPTLVTTISSLQVTQAIKLLLNKDYEKDMIHIDIWNNTFEKIKIKPNPDCKVCQGKTTQENFRINKCKTKAAYSARPIKNIKLDLNKLKQKFNTKVETPILIIIEEQGHEIIIHKHGEVLFKDLEDQNLIKEIARKIFK